MIQSVLLQIAVAALLGVVIGVCLYRIRAIRRLQRQHDAHQQEIEQRDARLTTILAEQERTALALDQERAASQRLQESGNQSDAQHEALQVHSRLQAQRITTLESELLAAEEQHMRLERDFASYKANKFRELQVLRADNEGRHSGEPPVLSTRARDVARTPALERRASPSSFSAWSQRGTSAGMDRGNQHTDPDTGSDPTNPTPARQADVAEKGLRGSLERSLLAREFEIPSLAESELPDSIDGLNFDIAPGVEEVSETEKETLPSG